MSPMGGLLPPSLLPRRIGCNVLLLETDAGLALVDTGVGRAAAADPNPFSPARSIGTRRDPGSTVHAQVLGLGLRAEDVAHVVLTHFDFDHAGGLPDFPRAAVHTLAAERDAARARRGWMGRRRYDPAHWAHGPRWETYEPGEGEPWNGFARTRALRGLPPEVLMVSLPGHTPGHAGVAVRTADGWLLHAGDAFYEAGEMRQPPRSAALMKVFQRLADADRERAEETRARLRRLAAPGSGVRVICAHDPDARL